MRRRLALLVLGAAIGSSLTIAALLGVREYRREAAATDDARGADLGAGQFEAVNDSNDGLGPGFNATSCSTCHSIPAMGGSGTLTTLRVARRDPDGAYHEYPGAQVVHRFSARGCDPVMPPDANVFSHRIPTSTFGAGLVEAIPDELLIALEDPDDRDGDGISGRAARIVDRASGAPRVGRFGWKSQHATLLAFAGEAYLNEMGITNALYPNDQVVGVTAARLRECEAVGDPEDSGDSDAGIRSIDKLTSFMQSLPAPQPQPVPAADRAGESLFASVGCAACHRPQVGAARAYSDFLLHDIGTGDGIREGDAAPEEMRTAPLWGIRSRQIYLHDGSAPSIAAALARHDGEAARARQGFGALPAEQQRQLLAFVHSR